MRNEEDVVHDPSDVNEERKVGSSMKQELRF